MIVDDVTVSKNTKDQIIVDIVVGEGLSHMLIFSSFDNAMLFVELLSDELLKLNNYKEENE